MTKLLDQAIETARALPPDVQDDIARVVLQLTGSEQPGYVFDCGRKGVFRQVSR
jgi:hypothetical protein